MLDARPQQTASITLFKGGIDGIWKTSLQGTDGRFVENVGLVRVPPDVAAALAIIAVQAALTEVSAKLDIIIADVQNLANLVRLANQGGLKGAIDALEAAKHLKDDGEKSAVAELSWRRCNSTE